MLTPYLKASSGGRDFSRGQPPQLDAQVPANERRSVAPAALREHLRLALRATPRGRAVGPRVLAHVRVDGPRAQGDRGGVGTEIAERELYSVEVVLQDRRVPEDLVPMPQRGSGP